MKIFPFFVVVVCLLLTGQAWAQMMPCPFDGSAAKLDTLNYCWIDGTWHKSFVVRCVVNHRGSIMNTPKEAVAVWNKRYRLLNMNDP